MAVSQGRRVLAAEYNSLQSRIERLLGIGTSTFGYGQPVSSNPVSSGRSVSAANLVKLRTDMAKAYTFQTGDSIPLTAIALGDLIGADESEGDPTKGLNDYFDLMTELESNRFVFDDTQVEVVPSEVSDQRTSSWSRITITSEVSLTFNSSNARRNFFNAGGQIRISGVVSNLADNSESFLRNQGWKQLIENPGIILFDRNSVNVTNTGALGLHFPQGHDFGNDHVNDSYVEIFRKEASGSVYSDSYWKIEVRSPTPSSIRFRVSLYDKGPESDSDATSGPGDTPLPGSVYGGVNEPVTADITMRYGGRRAAGTVEVPFPIFSIINSFQ